MNNVPSGYVPVKSQRIIELCEEARIRVAAHYQTKKDEVISKYLGTEQRVKWWKPKQLLATPEGVVEWLKSLDMLHDARYEYDWYAYDYYGHYPFIESIQSTAQSTEEWYMSVETFNRLIKLSNY